MEPSLELRLIIAFLINNNLDTLQLIQNPKINWQLFYQLVVQHRVWQQAYSKLSKIDTNIIKLIPIYSDLARLSANNKLQILTLARETVQISKLFTKNNLLHCFLKGIVLNVHIYNDLTSRPCRDIDIWVGDDDYEKALALLIDLGYQQRSPTYQLSGFKRNYYLVHRHDIALYHPISQILVELHFHIEYFKTDCKILTKENLQTVAILNTPTATLNDNLLLLYLMIHATYHAFARLRWLNDIVLYINSQKCDLDHVMKLANDLDCLHIVEQSLILVKDIFKIEDPYLNKIVANASKKGKQLARMANYFINANYELSGIASLSKPFFIYRFYLLKVAFKGQKIRTVCSDLFKLDLLFPYLSLPDKLWPLYYAIYPFWIIKQIIGVIPKKIFRRERIS